MKNNLTSYQYLSVVISIGIGLFLGASCGASNEKVNPQKIGTQPEDANETEEEKNQHVRGELFPINFDLDDCDCDHVIAPDESERDGRQFKKGEVLCLDARQASERGPLKILDLNGTADAPIFLRSCKGTVKITSDNHRAALWMGGSYFRVTGKSNTSSHGIILDAPRSPHTFKITRAHHYEVDHLEIQSSNFAGMMFKEDPSSSDCRIGDRRYDDFEMDTVYIHHNWIHDVVGEAIYVGNSFFTGINHHYCGANPNCDLSRCEGMQYPHVVRNIQVHHNEIERTGWDGIQIGSAVTECRIGDNQISDFAQRNQSSHDHGIQVGDGSSCHVEGNVISGGGIGIHLAGIGGSVVKDNHIADFKTFGIIVNPRPAPLQSDIQGALYVDGFKILNNVLRSQINTGPVIRDVNVPSNPVPESGNEVRANTIEAKNDRFQLNPRYQWLDSENIIQ